MNQEPSPQNREPATASLAAQWVQQWVAAAPRLQAIRDEELRRRGESCSQPSTIGGLSAIHNSGSRVYMKYPERHGMVIMQRWFQRRRMLELNELNLSTHRNGQAGGASRIKAVDLELKMLAELKEEPEILDHLANLRQSLHGEPSTKN